MEMLSSLARREINILGMGLVFVLLFSVYRFGVEPAIEKRDNLKRVLTERQTAFQQMVALEKKYNTIHQKQAVPDNRQVVKENGFSLFAFLDRQARQSGIKKQVAYMKPFTKQMDDPEYTLMTVKVKLSKSYLKQVVDFLYKIESSSKGVKISSLSLSRTGRGDKRLDVVLETQVVVLTSAGKKDTRIRSQKSKGLST